MLKAIMAAVDALTSLKDRLFRQIRQRIPTHGVVAAF